jgi:hypothetical protein
MTLQLRTHSKWIKRTHVALDGEIGTGGHQQLHHGAVALRGRPVQCCVLELGWKRKMR